MENLKISVIIPTYNSARTLEATIISCLNQTLPPIEVLVCDDGSTDNSKELVEKINNPIIKWIPSSHSGTPAVPRNNGLDVSNGEWIAFCDSDDKWLPTKLEKQIELVNKLGYKASCTSALISIEGIMDGKLVSNWKKPTIKFSDILRCNDIVCSSALIHRSLISKTGEFSTVVANRSFADYIYWLRVLTITNFAFVNEPLVIYDDHPETSIRSDKNRDKDIQEISFADLIIWMKNGKENYFKILYFKTIINLYLIKNRILLILKKILK